MRSSVTHLLMSMRLLTPVAHVPGTSGSSDSEPPPLARDILAARMKKVDRKLGEGAGHWENGVRRGL